MFKEVLSSIEDLVFEQTDEECVEELWEYHITASENSWTRAARRKRMRESKATDGPDDTPVRKAARFEGKVLARDMPPSTIASTMPYPRLACKIFQKLENAIVEIQWVRGKDRELFEGFWNHVSKKVREKEKG